MNGFICSMTGSSALTEKRLCSVTHPDFPADVKRSKMHMRWHSLRSHVHPHIIIVENYEIMKGRKRVCS